MWEDTLETKTENFERMPISGIANSALLHDASHPLPPPWMNGVQIFAVTQKRCNPHTTLYNQARHYQAARSTDARQMQNTTAYCGSCMVDKETDPTSLPSPILHSNPTPPSAQPAGSRLDMILPATPSSKIYNKATQGNTQHCDKARQSKPENKGTDPPMSQDPDLPLMPPPLF